MRAAATVIIKDAEKMTPKGRKDIAEWLRMHAEMLVKYGKDYDKAFRGRYMYVER